MGSGIAFQIALEESWAHRDLVADVLARHQAQWSHLVVPTPIRLEQASREADVKLATDYQCISPGFILPVAFRERSFEYLGRFGREFVLRASAPEPHRTEAEKILTDPDTARLYLYAFLDPTGTQFTQYLLVDLVRLRQVWAQPGADALLGAKEVRFRDGELGFALSVDRLANNSCLLAARLATRAVPSQRLARDVLSGTPAYEHLHADDRSRAEILIMNLLFRTTDYRIGDPVWG